MCDKTSHEVSSPRVIGIVALDITSSGGIRTVAEFLIRTIRELSDYQVMVVSLSASRRDSNSRRLLDPSSWLRGPRCTKTRWNDLDCIHVGSDWAEFEFQRYRARTVLAEALEGCDLIQVVAGSPAVALSCVGLGKPIVLQVATRAVVERRMRDSGDAGVSSAWRRFMTMITNRLDDRAIGTVDTVMVENPWMLDYCASIGNGASTSVLFAPPGVDTLMFSPANSGRQLGDGGAYILSVGRWDDPRKNALFLLEAYRRLRETCSEAPFLILAGSAAPPKKFWDAVDSYSLRHCVRFIERPSWPELISLYQNATCFALPSDEEGFGMVVIEALACGIPVVATKCGGPEGIISHGVDGFLISLGDVTSFAEFMRILCSASETNFRMGEQAREKVVQEFSLGVAGQRFIDVYDGFLRGKITTVR